MRSCAVETRKHLCLIFKKPPCSECGGFLCLFWFRKSKINTKNLPVLIKAVFLDWAQVFPCFHCAGSQLLTVIYLRSYWTTQIWEGWSIYWHMSQFSKVVIKKHPAYKKSGALFNRTIVWGVVLLLCFYSNEDFLSLLKTKWFRSWHLIVLWLARLI